MMQHNKHDSYLDCLADISTQLLSAPDPWSVLPVIIDWLRQITGVERCYLIEFRQLDEAQWHGAVLFESLAPDTAVADSTRDQLTWDTSAGLPAWLDSLSTGNELQGDVSSIEPGTAADFIIHGATWSLNLPLMVNQGLAGCIGLDVADPDNRPGDQDISLMRAVANLISAALERVDSERKLRATHAMLSTILRSADELTMIATDLKLRVLHYNPGAEDLFGYAEQQVVGRSLAELEILELPGGDLTDDFLSIMIGEGPINLESEIRDPQGEYRTVTINVSGMYDAAGSPVGYLIIVRNVTEERRQQKRTMQSQRMESVGLLAGGVAHDFNNILMGILGYSSLVKDLLDQKHPAYRMIQTIEQSGERAAGLTNELLAYARGGKYRSVALRLDEQTDELINILATNLPRGIKLTRHYTPELPFVLGDPVQLQQVIMNICLNAGDAIREQAKTLDGEDFPGEIVFSTHVTGMDLASLARYEEAEEAEPGRFVVLSIRDNGCGMDAETKAKIFEPFFTTKFTGRGLGLAAVDGIVRNHGGFLTVESQPGVGTCFVLHLPVTTIFEEQAATEGGMILTGAETILFVDDEDIIRQLALLTLANLGYHVLLAGTGREALADYQDHHGEISLVVLDMVMPGLSGEVTVSELLRINPTARILLTSGFDEETARSMGDYTRIAGFLQKPYTPEAISRAVRKILNIE